MGYLPNMALYASANANAYRSKFDIFDTKKGWYPMVVVGARIGVSIFDGLQNQHRIQASKMEVLKAENNMRMVQQSIDLEISSAKANLTNAASALDTQKKNIELAENIYKTSKIKYEQGVGSSLEVMSAETALKESQTNYFSALYDALISKVDYDKANGNIK
jgi:outer membrane protein TolC